MHKELITHLFYRLFIAKPSGINKKIWEDPRDFDLGIFGWGATYKPKHNHVLIKTKRVIDQGSFNICQWCASTTAKEVEENTILAERSLICKGVEMGLVSGNGFSDLDAGDKVLKEWGIVDAEHFDNDYCYGNWYEFAKKQVNTAEIKALAGLHKIASHWKLNKRGDILKLLDDGKVLKTAILWFTGFNQGGGFAIRKFIMDRFVGYSVGGHCFVCIGYILNFIGIDKFNKIVTGKGGRNVYVKQNSYGSQWGQTIIDDDGTIYNGLFFSDMDFFDKQGWGFKATLDMPLDVAHFITDYNNMNVKAEGDSSVWYISQGKKHKYLTPLSLKKSGKDPMIVNKEILDKTPIGDNVK
jgi:hypothetical protein